MMRTIAVAVASLAALSAAAVAQVNEENRVREATIVINEIMASPDAGVPKSVRDKAEAIAVFPSVVRGAFVVGGQHGRGILTVRDRATNTWSLPAFVSITGGSIGIQFGGQAVDLVLVIQNERGLKQLMRNQFKIGVDGSAAAGPVGRSAEASTDIQLRAEILSYSRSRGLFIGISLDGSSVYQDRDANERLYGRRLETSDVVREKPASVPDVVKAWWGTLGRYF